MSNPLNVTYVDLVGPTVSAAWLNAVGSSCLALEALAGTPTNITATSGQQVFTIPSTALGVVYINGVFQIPSVSYSRTTSTTITFTAAVPVTAVVTVF
jgi:hypothetical protein